MEIKIPKVNLEREPLPSLPDLADIIAMEVSWNEAYIVWREKIFQGSICDGRESCLLGRCIGKIGNLEKQFLQLSSS
jgi:hypothetical protein